MCLHKRSVSPAQEPAHATSPAHQTSFDSDASLLRLTDADAPDLHMHHLRSAHPAGGVPLLAPPFMLTSTWRKTVA